MNIKVLAEKDNEIVLLMQGTNAVTANTIRRCVVEYVPTLAVEEVTFDRNGSALYDEIVAHRLGLVPLKTDLKSYNMRSECKCEGKGCAMCKLAFSLKAKGPCMVYASDMKLQDPKVKVVHEKIPIVSLLKGQELKVEGYVVLGNGIMHSKFIPGHIYYKGVPELKAEKDSNLKRCVEMCKGAVVQKGNSLEIKDLMQWNEAFEEICESNGVKISASQEDFIFFVEGWGQLTPKEILMKALEIFDDKLGEFEKLVGKIK